MGGGGWLVDDEVQEDQAVIYATTDRLACKVLAGAADVQVPATCFILLSSDGTRRIPGQLSTSNLPITVRYQYVGR